MGYGLEKLADQFRASLKERSEAIDLRLAAAPEFPTKGDICALLEEDCCCTWLLVFTHPEDSQLWFTVPGDNICDTIGTNDVDVSSSVPGGPCIFRCGYGVWIHEDDLGLLMRINHLEASHVHCVHERIAAITTGTTPDDLWLTENDDSEHYQDWTSVVANESRRLSERIASLSETPNHDLPWVEMVLRSIPRDPSTQLSDLNPEMGIGLLLSQHEQPMLAAASGDEQPLENNLTVSTADYEQIYDSDAHLIIAFKYESGIVLKCLGKTSREPASVIVHLSNEELNLEWKEIQPGNFDASQIIPWKNRMIRIEISGRIIEVHETPTNASE